MAFDLEFNGLKSALFDKYFGFLNPRQREAVYHTQGPLLVLAGAGSGKTTVIVNRIANIILFGSAANDKNLPRNANALLPIMKNALDCGNAEEIREVLKKCAVEPAHPYRVLCITFTNKAANEFKERLEKTLGKQARDIWAGTFHSVCVRILRRHIDRLGYTSDFTIYDTDDSKKLISDILKELDIDEKLLSPRDALSSISKSKESSRTPYDELADAGRNRLLLNTAKVYDLYCKRLKAANALDFDDIIMLTNNLFEAFPDVLERYREQFKYILVDEYQDTNPSQSRLVNLLSGRHKNVCVVGDDDQSIYSFRGATVENILGFDREYGNARVIKLEQNYRSTGNILGAANAIIANNRGRKGKNLWTESGEGEKVMVRRLYSQSEEADFICNTIEEKVRKGAKYSDFAVLYRVNALSNSLETAFVKKRIPYKIFGGLRFYERREIKDILAYLSVVSNRADTVRLKRIINIPKRAIGDATVEKITALADAEGCTVFDIIENADKYSELSRSSQKLISFANLINRLGDYSGSHTVSETVSYVIEESGYRAFLSQEDDGEAREENILELISSAKLFEETAENPTLSEFLNEISLVSDLDSYDSSTDSVALMTVHSAKGLEFPNVFIAGFEDGMFPIAKSLSEGDKGLEEERRLAYVAVTRAKKELYLLYTQSRMLYGRSEGRVISRFSNEIPEEFCDRKAVDTRRGYASPINENAEADHESRNSFLKNIRSAYETRTEETHFPVGTAVSHPMFGEGTILSAAPMGGDVLYEIEFANGSTKRLMGNFAKLKKV